MTTIFAQTVLSSQIAGRSNRLTTLLLRYPRWIHAEGRTHRIISIEEDMEILIPTPGFMNSPQLSKNAGSSRAVPVHKMIADILADPAIPLFWGKNVGGMQAKEELPDHLIELAKEIWLDGMHDEISRAEKMAALWTDDDGNVVGAHKQIINRMLEPYSHITVLASATEWDNFLDLRVHGDAEPHINVLAKLIQAELKKPPMQILEPGDWHTPFVDSIKDGGSQIFFKTFSTDAGDVREYLQPDDAIQLSVSCSASTSYKTVEGFDMTKDRAIWLYDKLVTSKPIHASPAEHVAQADTFREAGYDEMTDTFKEDRWDNPEEHRNFVGFRQHRAMIGA